MGLDLYHFRVNDEKRGEPRSIHPGIEGFSAMLRKFACCTVTIHNEQTDWEATLAAHGFLLEHFQAGVAQTPDWSTRQMIGYFAFGRRKSAPRGLPELIVFNNLGRDDDLMLTMVRSRQPDIEPTVLRGPLKVHRIAETAVFCEQIGYQRKSVHRSFYDEFKPDAYVTDIERVRKIYELTEPDEKARFKELFLDNWAAQSFVQVSW